MIEIHVARTCVAIASPCPPTQPLGDEASGTGSPTASTQEVVDPAGLNGLVALQSDFPPRAFRVDGVESYKVDRRVVVSDEWALDLIGARLEFKDFELKDDPDFSSRRPSNAFRIQRLARLDGVKEKFLPAAVRHARRRLRYVARSIDDVDDYELAPVGALRSGL